jgi:hypothetical protein
MKYIDQGANSDITFFMTEYELLRIITFLERMRSPYDNLLTMAEPDANWNIALYLIKHHLRGERVTKSSLALAANVPFASAMRRIHKLIKDGDYVSRMKELFETQLCNSATNHSITARTRCGTCRWDECTNQMSVCSLWD